MLSPEALQKDFEILRYQLENVHPGLYTYTSKKEMDKQFDNIKNKLNVAQNSADFFKNLLPILKPIGNNHTSIKAPQDYVDFLLNSAYRFPMKVYIRKDSLYVLSDLSNEKIIGNGKLIKSINGVASQAIIQQIINLRSTDGYNRTYPMHVASYTFIRYYAYLYGHPEQFEMEYFNRENKLEKTVIKALTVAQIKENEKTITIKAKVEKDFQLTINNGIGILRLSLIHISEPTRPY